MAKVVIWPERKVSERSAGDRLGRRGLLFQLLSRFAHAG